MKTFKFYLILLSAVSLSIFIFSCVKEESKSEKQEIKNQEIESRTDLNFCSPATPIGCNSYWRNPVQVAYQGCMITVKYRVVKCGNTFNIGDFEILSWGTNPSCFSLLSQLSTYYNSNDWTNY